MFKVWGVGFIGFVTIGFCFPGFARSSNMSPKHEINTVESLIEGSADFATRATLYHYRYPNCGGK